MTMVNIHNLIGWDRCANLDCQRLLTDDPVILLTTGRLRRFCLVSCIQDGQNAWHHAIYESSYSPDEGLINIDKTIRRLWPIKKEIE